MKTYIKFALLIILFSSCGGTYENDDIVWEKAFNEEKPDEINLSHSYFWKSSHWTYECIIYMEIGYNQKWLLSKIKEYKMDATLDFTKAGIGLFDERPHWFAPKTEENYILFKSKVSPELMILLDKKTNVMYFTYTQL